MLLGKYKGDNMKMHIPGNHMQVGDLVRSRYASIRIWDKNQEETIKNISNQQYGKYELMIILELPMNNYYFHVCASDGTCGYVLCSELLRV